jgi:hypothetical protein
MLTNSQALITETHSPLIGYEKNIKNWKNEYCIKIFEKFVKFNNRFKMKGFEMTASTSISNHSGGINPVSGTVVHC